MSTRVLALAVCGLVAGCGTAPLGPVQTAGGGMSSRVDVVEASELPPPSSEDMFRQQRPYRIGPLDKLTIDVFGIDDFSQREFQIDAGGRISFPLAGTIEAAGKTPAELELELEERLRQVYIRDPQVTVNLKETVSQVITIDGQVQKPGLYPVIGRMTLMRAVATASGLGEYAQEDHVVIFRTVEGQPMAALYNLAGIRRGLYDDPEVYASDVIIVGDAHARRLFKDALQVLPVLTTPLIIALQR